MTFGPWTDWIASGLLILGGIFTFGAGLGLIRLPDFFSRLHAVSMAGTMGGGLAAWAVAFAFPELDTITKVVMTVAFLLIGGPLGSHLLARAAYRGGEPMWEKSVTDELNDPHPPDTL